MLFNTVLAFSLVTTSFAIATASLLAISVVRNKDQRLRRRLLGSDDTGKVVFLYENERLVDATPEARRILTTGAEADTGFTHLSGLLHPRFPSLGDQIKDLSELGSMTLTSLDRTCRIDAEWHGGVARITLVDEETAEPSIEMDRHSMRALEGELESLRAVAERVPYLTWRENECGDIVWANRAYLDLAGAMTPVTDAPPWPPQRLFDRPARLSEAGKPRRTALSLPGNETRHWFDIQETPLGDQVLITALPIDAVVRAETTHTEFVTTLTKTFAHLPVGLAIFNRARQLALFNPALTDLTGLPAQFLCAHPTLFSFLDQLREKRMIPEPKDYKSWRQQMADLEAKAVDGTYEETWSLPTGQTYRITGRPHPDGAVAFLFEDISAEISLTRRFRTELEMGQAALDASTDAVAVFSAGGTLAMSNAAYSALWGNDPATDLNDINIGEATHRWHNACAPTPVWTELRKFVSSTGARTDLTASLSLKDGRMLFCRAKAIAQGATLVSFEVLERSIFAPEPTMRPDLVGAQM